MNEDKITALTTIQQGIRRDYLHLSVYDDVSLSAASEALSKIRIYLRKVEATRTEMVKPFNDGVKALNARVHAITDPIKQLDNEITQKIKDYRAMVEAQRAEEQKRLDAQAQANLTKDSLIPEAIAPIVPAQAKSVQLANGKITFMKVRKWEVEDIYLVPPIFMKLDEARVTATIKAGVDIPGIKTWWEEIPQVRQ